MRSKPIFVALALSLALPSSTAEGAREKWLIAAEASATQAVTDPQLTLFGPGATASATLMRSLSSWFVVGLRARALVVTDRNAAPEDDALAEPGHGGLYVLSPVLRLRPLGTGESDTRATGLYVEGGGGPGLTGDRVRASVHGALGYGFDLGSVVLGPTARYIQVIETTGPSKEDARFVALGLELTFLDEPPPRPKPLPLRVVEPIKIARNETPKESEVEPPPPEDTDGDGINDDMDECPIHVETANGINDDDGCPDEKVLEPVHGRVVVDDAILFETGRSELNPEGKALIRDLAQRWKANPEWVGLRVEGHADARGTRDYNLKLSIRRAQAVRRALIRYGIQAGAVHTEGFGEDRPRDPGRTAEAHRKNRRVEFVVIRREELGARAEEAPK